MKKETLLEQIRKECQELERTIEADFAGGVENADDFNDKDDILLDLMINYLAECSYVFSDLADLEAELIKHFSDKHIEIRKGSYEKYMMKAEQIFNERKGSHFQDLLCASADISFDELQEANEKDEERSRKVIFEALEELEDGS